MPLKEATASNTKIQQIFRELLQQGQHPLTRQRAPPISSGT